MVTNSFRNRICVQPMEWLNMHLTWHIFFYSRVGGVGIFSPLLQQCTIAKGCVDFFLQQECIIDTYKTCKSELMFGFDLAPCNLATFHLVLVFHTICVQKMAPSMKANVKQKGEERFKTKKSTLKSLSQLECQVHILIHNEFFLMEEFLKSSCIFGFCASK